MARVSVNERAFLVLEDGTWYAGRAVGARGKAIGDVAFVTAMTGYQEALTDPSFRGHLIVMTYPLVGNYGVNDEDAESSALHARALIMREMCETPSNWRAKGSLEAYLRKHGVVAVAGVDTRALVRHLGQVGPMRGVVATGEVDVALLAEEARQAPLLSDQDLVSEVMTKEAYLYSEGEGPRVTVIDCGTRRSLLNSFVNRGCRVTVVPASSTADEIFATEPEGIVISNGPGDPMGTQHLVETVKQLVRSGGVPLLGIGLGHQVIALALGAKTVRLTRGHRGANQPVKDLESGRVYITAQNHGFAVVEGSWDDPDLLVTHRNVNDGTIEGLSHRRLPIASVQFQPEVPSGLADAAYIVDRFVSSLESKTV